MYNFPIRYRNVHNNPISSAKGVMPGQKVCDNEKGTEMPIAVFLFSKIVDEDEIVVKEKINISNGQQEDSDNETDQAKSALFLYF